MQKAKYETIVQNLSFRYYKLPGHEDHVKLMAYSITKRNKIIDQLLLKRIVQIPNLEKRAKNHFQKND